MTINLPPTPEQSGSGLLAHLKHALCIIHGCCHGKMKGGLVPAQRREGKWAWHLFSPSCSPFHPFFLGCLSGLCGQMNLAWRLSSTRVEKRNRKAFIVIVQQASCKHNEITGGVDKVPVQQHSPTVKTFSFEGSHYPSHRTKLRGPWHICICKIMRQCGGSSDPSNAGFTLKYLFRYR